MASRAEPRSSLFQTLVQGATGEPGRLLLSWGMAGGIVAGGMFVSLAVLGGSGSHLSGVPILFLLGALAGVVHGSLLAVAGRPADQSCLQAVRDLSFASLCLFPALVLAWVITAWISFSHAFMITGNWPGVLVAAFAWVLGLGVCFWAGSEGCTAVGRSYERWPESRSGSLLLAVVLAALILWFLLQRPEIWGTELRVNGIGAVLLAFGATIWIALPVVVVALHVIHVRVAGGDGMPRTMSR